MPIAVTCAKCNRKYQARDELAGKTTKCQCGEKLSIPQAHPAGLASLLDEESIGTGAKADPFAGIPTEAEAMPMPQVKRPKAKKGVRVEFNPKILAIALGGLAACVLLGVAVYSGIGLLSAAFEPRWKTPQEVFDASFKAADANDWKTYYETICPADQNRAVRDMLLGAMTGAEMMPQLKSICDKYGATPVSFLSITNKEQLDAVYNQATSKVAGMSSSSKLGLFLDMAAVVSDEDKLPNRYPRGIDSNVRFFSSAKGGKECKLTDVKIKDDRAKGRIETHYSNSTIGHPIEFIRVGGEWRRVIWGDN
jgi:hypothetical protein